MKPNSENIDDVVLALLHLTKYARALTDLPSRTGLFAWTGVDLAGRYREVEFVAPIKAR